MSLVVERDALIPTRVACSALWVSAATLYRRVAPRLVVDVAAAPASPRKPHPRSLSEAERTEVLAVLHSEALCDQPPSEVYAHLLEQGKYLASVRTMYRVLASLGETDERRAQRVRTAHEKPSLTAHAPNEVWTWDITKLATERKNVFFMVYAIIDLYSRYVVGWMLAEKESQHHAATLFTETIARHGVLPDITTVHSDRGAVMRSDTLAQLFATCGVSTSFSRPRVSNDNPFIESLFKTLKYQPDYPGKFKTMADAQAYMQSFFGWVNEHHHHDGLEGFTPSDVFHGRVAEVAAVRQAALNAAYAAHPQRFSKGPPKVKLPPAKVSINPVVSDAASLTQAAIAT